MAMFLPGLGENSALVNMFDDQITQVKEALALVREVWGQLIPRD
jgi:hypothetical protein